MGGWVPLARGPGCPSTASAVSCGPWFPVRALISTRETRCLQPPWDCQPSSGPAAAGHTVSLYDVLVRLLQLTALPAVAMSPQPFTDFLGCFSSRYFCASPSCSPLGDSVKNRLQGRRRRRPQLDPWIRKIPGRRAW